MLTNLCDHGLIGRSLARKVIRSVKESRRSPDEAVSDLSRICTCGHFNARRARRILKEIHNDTP